MRELKSEHFIVEGGFSGEHTHIAAVHCIQKYAFLCNDLKARPNKTKVVFVLIKLAFLWKII